ncbi:hypothetical protein OWR29_25630 [Actinoplanes sp. Pm04-4]|uniref:Uncharacterized protein n=1 Tax=Paractinoplanes pyxinae TaxID=2997416 RepID=A0ABT4B4H1_9ACTN|nr:hypothetical protein [Actinoplanes pyxinae]MCY1141394.1 hypothetical protein [Actinoplanes pyxinae]
MQLVQVLDVIERLLVASEHPDIVSVERYGTATEPWGPDVARNRAQGSIAGVKVTHASTSSALLNGRIAPNAVPVIAPSEVPPPSLRAPRLVMFVSQLLDVARPREFASWQLVSQPDGPSDLPYGIGIACADGTNMLLMCQSTGAMVGSEPSEEPFPDYVIPEGVKTCLQEVSAHRAAPA